MIRSMTRLAAGRGALRRALAASAGWAQEAKELRIVKQPGLGYLQLIVMREQKTLEKRLPGVEIEWRQLTSGPVIRDAMLAGQMDVGSGGVGPFVQAIDKGLDWKALGALNEMPLYLNCARADIKTLKDVKPGDRIAMPAIGSMQHVVLQMQAEKDLGDPKKLNQQVVAMAHPDATAAILSKREITCHLSVAALPVRAAPRPRHPQGLRQLSDGGRPAHVQPRLGEREVGEGQPAARPGLRRVAQGGHRLHQRPSGGGGAPVRGEREGEVDARADPRDHEAGRHQVHDDARRPHALRHLHAEDRDDQGGARVLARLRLRPSPRAARQLNGDLGDPAALLSVSDVTISYPTEHGVYTAVEDVSFSVSHGEKFVLLGPSGCGKSTLLKSIAGFVAPARGRVELDGRAVSRPGPDRVVVFQEFDQLLPWKTVLANVAYPLRVARKMSAEAARHEAVRFIEMVGLTGFSDSYPHQLSGGMKQRVAIARSLALDPAMLLMDEPFASLDAMTRRRMQEELLGIWEATRKTLLFVTHSIQEAVLLGDRILILSKGPGRVRRIVDNRAVGQRETAGSLDAQREIQEILDV